MKHGIHNSRKSSCFVCGKQRHSGLRAGRALQPLGTQPAYKQCTYPEIQGQAHSPPPTPSLTSCYPLCLLVTILSSRPRGTLEGTEVENRSGKGTVLPFRWTGINGGEAHPEKSKLGVTDQPGSAPRLRGEAGGEVSGEARVWLASWQDGNPEGSSPPILAPLPLHSSHSEGPTGRS